MFVFLLLGIYQSTQQLGGLNLVSKDSSKSYENLANALKTENNSIDSTASTTNTATNNNNNTKKDENTHSFNRLVKIASNWHSKSRSSSTSSNYPPQAKVIDRGLISQSKIRQTQMFLNDSLEYANSESALSRKMAELCEISPSNSHHKYNYSYTGDETSSYAKGGDIFSRSKSLRLKTPQKQQLVLPSRRMDDSANDSSKLEANEAYSNINYWKPNETTTNTLVSENGDKTNELQSGRNSFIYSRKSSRSIELVNLNKAASKQLTGNKVFHKYSNAGASGSGAPNSKTETPQLNKVAQYAIEIQ